MLSLHLFLVSTGQYSLHSRMSLHVACSGYSIVLFQKVYPFDRKSIVSWYIPQKSFLKFIFLRLSRFINDQSTLFFSPWYVVKTRSYNSVFCDSVAKKKEVFTHHQYFTFDFCQCASDIFSNAHLCSDLRSYSLSEADNLLCRTVSRNSFRLWSLHVTLHPKPSWFAWIACKTIMLL